jgi:hypothetical protein
MPWGPNFVETMLPVARRLAIHSADARGFDAIHAVHDGGQRQKPATLSLSFERLASRRSSQAE